MSSWRMVTALGLGMAAVAGCGNDDGDARGATGGAAGDATGGTGGSETSGTGGSETSGTGGSETSGTGGSETSGTGGSETSGTGGSETSGTGGSDTGGGGGAETGGAGGIETGGTGGSEMGGNGGSETGGNGGSETGGTGGTAGATTDDGWLYTQGNRIYRSDGTPFRGRGANLHDTRSCWRCAWSAPNPDEVIRRMDALVDDWGANFIRIVLESYGEGSTEQQDGAVQYGNVLEDSDYLEDVQTIVEHAGTKPGVVVLLSLWVDPGTDDMGWPTEQTRDAWRLLTQTFSTTPHVMFGIINEPQSNYDGSRDAEVWNAMNLTVEAIREEEDLASTPHHIITVQGTGGWARFLDYYIDHPIEAGGGENVAYEVHVYDSEDDFDDRFVTPSATLPVVIGEFGPDGTYMTMDDAAALMPLAEDHGVPYLAWTFHMNCPPNLLEDTANGCVAGTELRPTAWGELLQGRLATAW
jgi:hypothetical protein